MPKRPEQNGLKGMHLCFCLVFIIELHFCSRLHLKYLDEELRTLKKENGIIKHCKYSDFVTWDKRTLQQNLKSYVLIIDDIPSSAHPLGFIIDKSPESTRTLAHHLVRLCCLPKIKFRVSIFKGQQTRYSMKKMKQIQTILQQPRDENNIFNSVNLWTTPTVCDQHDLFVQSMNMETMSFGLAYSDEGALSKFHDDEHSSYMYMLRGSKQWLIRRRIGQAQHYTEYATATISSGQAIFIPKGWGHAVRMNDCKGFHII